MLNKTTDPAELFVSYHSMNCVWEADRNLLTFQLDEMGRDLPLTNIYPGNTVTSCFVNCLRKSVCLREGGDRQTDRQTEKQRERERLGKGEKEKEKMV